MIIAHPTDYSSPQGTPFGRQRLAAGDAELRIVEERQQLLENVWGYHFDGYQRTVDSHVRRLRKKLESDPKEPRFVETVFKVGYRFKEQP